MDIERGGWVCYNRDLARSTDNSIDTTVFLANNTHIENKSAAPSSSADKCVIATLMLDCPTDLHVIRSCHPVACQKLQCLQQILHLAIVQVIETNSTVAPNKVTR